MIATVNLAIGQVTPPVGVNLFVAIGVSEKLQGLRDKTKVTIVSMFQGCVAPDCGMHYCAAAHHLCALVLYRALVQANKHLLTWAVTALAVSDNTCYNYFKEAKQ